MIDNDIGINVDCFKVGGNEIFRGMVLWYDSVTVDGELKWQVTIFLVGFFFLFILLHELFLVSVS